MIDEITTVQGFSLMLGTIAMYAVQLAKQRWPDKIENLVAAGLAVGICVALAFALWGLDAAPDGLTWKASIVTGFDAGLKALGIYGLTKAVKGSSEEVEAKRAELPRSDEPVKIPIPRPSEPTIGRRP